MKKAIIIVVAFVFLVLAVFTILWKFTMCGNCGNPDLQNVNVMSNRR